MKSWRATFWSRVSKRLDGCWLWTGAKTADGYGAVTGGRTAHRASYELSIGNRRRYVRMPSMRCTSMRESSAPFPWLSDCQQR